MKNANVIVPIILVLVGLGVGFFGGYQYRNYRLNQTRGTFIGANGQRFTGARAGQGAVAGARGGAVAGSILSIDANSITVKLADGSTKIVLFSGSTMYSDTVTAAQTDLKVGSEVSVFGSANSDGSVTATNIQIRPSPTPAAK
jgi:hypothetical protein